MKCKCFFNLVGVFSGTDDVILEKQQLKLKANKSFFFGKKSLAKLIDF